MLVREKDPVIETLYAMQKQFQQIRKNYLTFNQFSFFLHLHGFRNVMTTLLARPGIMETPMAIAPQARFPPLLGKVCKLAVTTVAWE